MHRLKYVLVAAAGVLAASIILSSPAMAVDTVGHFDQFWANAHPAVMFGAFVASSIAVFKLFDVAASQFNRWRMTPSAPDLRQPAPLGPVYELSYATDGHSLAAYHMRC